MLYSWRKRQEELAEREAAGENLWTDQFDAAVRTKLVLIMKTLTSNDGWGHNRLEQARSLMLHDLGVFYLSNRHADPDKDLLAAVLESNSEIVATAIEAVWGMLGRDCNGYSSSDCHIFAFRVNEIFREHRISYELIEGTIVDFKSKELHTEVVAPTLRLLSGREGWEGVEVTYQKALKEIGDDPADAITDAGTALQEALTLLGCEGNSLGPLTKSAQKKSLLAPHDPRLVDWVAADRSQTGDAHSAARAVPEDAWLIVHVVGALILRLAGPGRGKDDPR